MDEKIFKEINEANEVDYIFVSEDEFMRLRDEGELLEYARVFDNYYATSRRQVEKHLANNRSVVLEIDWQGAQQVRKSMPECVTIFILPPSTTATRASKDGQVPINQSYGEWLAREPRSVQAEALGPGKVAYFNKLADKYGPRDAIAKLVRDDGAEVTLEQLRKRYGPA